MAEEKQRRPSEWRGLNGDCAAWKVHLWSKALLLLSSPVARHHHVRPYWNLRQKEKCVFLYIHLSKYIPIFWTKWVKVLKSLQPKHMSIYKALCCSICFHIIVNPHKSVRKKDLMGKWLQNRGLFRNDYSIAQQWGTVEQMNNNLSSFNIFIFCSWIFCINYDSLKVALKYYLSWLLRFLAPFEILYL